MRFPVEKSFYVDGEKAAYRQVNDPDPLHVAAELPSYPDLCSDLGEAKALLGEADWRLVVLAAQAIAERFPAAETPNPKVRVRELWDFICNDLGVEYIGGLEFKAALAAAGHRIGETEDGEETVSVPAAVWAAETARRRPYGQDWGFTAAGVTARWLAPVEVTRARLGSALLAHGELSALGVEGSASNIHLWRAAQRACRDLLEDLPARHVQEVVDHLARYYPACDEATEESPSSYVVKHAVEDALGRYVSNGELILATLVLGYPTRRDAPNLLIGTPEWVVASRAAYGRSVASARRREREAA